eukprot:1196183-Prorocentrum_minimum.AAC.5
MGRNHARSLANPLSSAQYYTHSGVFCGVCRHPSDCVEIATLPIDRFARATLRLVRKRYRRGGKHVLRSSRQPPTASKRNNGASKATFSTTIATTDCVQID